MARMEIDGLDDLITRMARAEGMGIRNAVKRIVTAGAEADAADLKKLTRESHHVLTGSMVENIRGGTYRETAGGGEINVYPQGEDSHGVSNAMKAFVINYGLGGRKKGKMGDKFITKNFKKTEAIVSAAMAAEAEKALSDMGIT